MYIGRRQAHIEHFSGEVRYEFLRGVPAQVTQAAGPDLLHNWVKPELGFYVQDQWTIRNATLNLGVRYDYFNAYAAAEHIPAGPFVPARDFPRVNNVPNWKDVVPRIGVSYDVFGNGKTAVKASLGKFVAQEVGLLTNEAMPANAIVGTASRLWSDSNGNFVPDCDLTNFTANGECGAINNNKFGTVNFTKRYAADVMTGFGNRPYSWQTSVILQHELRPGMALNAGYFRNWYGNFQAQNNVALQPADFNAYCLTTPADARLPGGGGQQICGIYDTTVAKFGVVDNVITQSRHFGKQSDVFNGVDVALNARFGRGGLLAGGVSIGRDVTDVCYTNETPQIQPSVGSVIGSAATGRTSFMLPTQPRLPAFCHISPPWSALTQLKLNGVYPLPWNLQASAVFQNVAGPAITANLVATNAQVAPSLGRNLSACGLSATCNATVLVPIIPNSSVFEDRINQLDLRFSRILPVKRGRLTASIDIYNVLNASSVLAINTTYGPNWRRPLQILGGRLLKFGAQIDY